MRPRAGLLLRLAGTDRWLLVRRRSGRWEFPKGRVGRNEHRLAAAVRECGEETGIRDARITGTEVIVPLPRRGGRLTRLHLFVAITRSARVALSAEHDGHRWATAAQALALLRRPELRAALLAAGEEPLAARQHP